MPKKSKGSSSSAASPSVAAVASNSTSTGSTRIARTLLQQNAVVPEEDHPDLVELEERLTEEVDEEFFMDPRKFHTLHRVIDVLGMQLDSGYNHHHNHTTKEESKISAQPQPRDIEANPAYQVLKRQQQVVEEAIEHLALIHCADLNGSVVQVGRVARQFQDAVTQVRQLRKQVKEIQETLGASNAAGDAVASGKGTSGTTGTGTNTSASATSSTSPANGTTAVAASTNSASHTLRELWLKKLEAEAVLSLLDKLDRIRAAPQQFDAWLYPHGCIGAAVTCVSQALDTMFSSDVSQVQALHKIMEQLMIRKQTAEELVWEVLMDVLFLRTGNGPAEYYWNKAIAQEQQQQQARSRSLWNANSSSGGGGGGGNKGGGKGLTVATGMTPAATGGATTSGTATGTADNEDEYEPPYQMCNPFLSHQGRYAMTHDLQVQPNHSSGAGTSSSGTHTGPAGLLLLDDDWQQDDELVLESMLIPNSVLEAEFDLESEERRHLEERKHQQQWLLEQNSSNNGNAGAESKQEDNIHNNSNNPTKRPQYGDHVLALRTLVECLIRLRRLDDVERILMERLAKEIERLVQREQARTFLRVERTGGAAGTRYANTGRGMGIMTGSGSSHLELREFRAHLQSVVSAFGNVQLRLAHLTQILRHRLVRANDKSMAHSAAYSNPSSAISTVLQTAKDVMERELKSFLDACLQETTEKEPEFNIHALTNVSGQSRQIAAKTAKQRGATGGLFSLGIIDHQAGKDKDSAASTAQAWLTASTTSRRSTIQSLATPKFVAEVLFAKTTHNGTPQVRHALFFRKALSKWHQDTMTLREQLAKATLEDTSAPSYRVKDETPALEYLDVVIQKDLLPILQEEAVNGTVQALERPDAFDPMLDRNVYARNDSNEPQDVDMCRACNALYHFTSPLFLALHRLPKGGEMYLPLVAVLEHVILTFISRVKQQVSRLCSNKTALQLIMDTAGQKDGVDFGTTMERRKAFAQLVLAYADGDLLEAAAVTEETEATVVPLLSPSASDSPNKAQLIHQSKMAALSGFVDLDFVGGVEREEVNLSNELAFVKPYLEFAGMEHNTAIQICSDEHLMKSACLAHSLLKLSSLLDSRLKVRSAVGGISSKTLLNTRALREAIKTIKANGLRMAKFCRADVLLQAVTRLAKVCNSSTVVARDAVRIPSSVNDLGEYMTSASDNLREAAGNAVTAYAFSTLEQYIPLCLIQTVRVLAAGKGIVTKAPLTMNGIEALDRSGSVLYRDLKGSTSFDNSFWDIELAAVSFERSASFIAMMELEMAELEAYYQENRNDFSEQDFQLMFGMNGPRRKGDIGRYHMLVKRLDSKK